MATRAWLGAIAVLAIAPAFCLPVEAAVYRIQARPLLPRPSLPLSESGLRPELPRSEPPLWLERVLRVVDGRLLTFAQPSWEGPFWRLGLEVGLRGRAHLIGPALLLNGRLNGGAWVLESQTTALASTKGITWLSELTLGRAPWTLSLRAWSGPGSKSVGQSATLSLRLGF